MILIHNTQSVRYQLNLHTIISWYLSPATRYIIDNFMILLVIAGHIVVSPESSPSCVSTKTAPKQAWVRYEDELGFYDLGLGRASYPSVRQNGVAWFHRRPASNPSRRLVRENTPLESVLLPRGLAKINVEASYIENPSHFYTFVTVTLCSC